VSIIPFQALAKRIDTGEDSPDTSRAFVVFNLTDLPLSGVAVFQAIMSWPRDTPLPPVAVTDMRGVPVAASIRDMMEGPDTKGRPDRCQLTFSLGFQVSDVPANGWRTYLAAYAQAPSPPLADFGATPGLVVVETTRHGGDLPPTGRLADLPPGWPGNF
jgi:hypothetical protein